MGFGLVLKHVLNARQVLKSVAACLQRERDSVRSDLLKADQENQTLSSKVADLTCKLSEASSQIKSLPNDGGGSKAGGNSGQEFVPKDAPEDAAQNVAQTTSQVTRIKRLCASVCRAARKCVRRPLPLSSVPHSPFLVVCRPICIGYMQGS